MAGFMERLAYVITANGKDAVREFRSVRDSATKDLGAAEGRIGKFGANAAGIGAGLKGFGAGIIASIGLGAVDDLTDAASQLEQSAAAIESVFGDAKATIEEFGETAADTAGLSKREVNQMAAVIGSQLQGMGFSVNEAADKVVVLQKRAADMAATFGGPTQQALTAIAALFRGERDPIEKYGVTIKEADVKARAAALGLDDTTLAAKRYSSAVASLDLVLQGTAKTQGQFARESNTAAGAAARAAAEYENAKAELGESLLPAQTFLTQRATTLAKNLGFIGGAIKDLVSGNDDLAESSENAADATAEQADAMESAADAASRASASVEDYTAALDGIQASAFGVQSAQDDVTQSLFDLVDKATQGDRKRESSAERVAETIERTNERIRDAEKSVVDAREDAGKINVPGVERDNANERLRDAVERLAEVRSEGQEAIAAAQETRDSIEDWTPALDRASSAGLKNREIFQQHVDLVLETAATMLEQGATAQEINDYIATQRGLLSDVATQVGFARDGMREFLDLLIEAQGLLAIPPPPEPEGPRLPIGPGGVRGPWSEEAVREWENRPRLPTVNGVTGPFTREYERLANAARPVAVTVNTGYVNNPQQLAEIIGREVSRQLRRRG